MNKIKPYLPLLSLIPIGLLMVASVWKTKHWVGFPIGLIGMLLIVLSLKGMEKKLKDSIEEQDPYFYDDPVLTEKWEKRLSIIAPAFLIISFMGMGIMRFFTINLIKEGLFALICTIFSGLTAYIIIYFILKKFPALKPTTDAKSKQILFLWAGFGLTIAQIVILLNFFLTPTSQSQKKVAILENGAKREKPEAYIWVDYDGDKMKLRPTAQDRKQLTNQDSSILTISTGALGFDYVSSMAPASPQ